VIISPSFVREGLHDAIAKPTFWDDVRTAPRSRLLEFGLMKITRPNVIVLVSQEYTQPFRLRAFVEALRSYPLPRTDQFSLMPPRVQQALRELAVGNPEMYAAIDRDEKFSFDLNLRANVENSQPPSVPGWRRLFLFMPVKRKAASPYAGERSREADTSTSKRATVPRTFTEDRIVQNLRFPHYARGVLAIVDTRIVFHKPVADAMAVFHEETMQSNQRLASSFQELLNAFGPLEDLMPGWNGQEPLSLSRFSDQQLTALANRFMTHPPVTVTPEFLSWFRSSRFAVRDGDISIRFRGTTSDQGHRMLVQGIRVRGTAP
jgi:hypothetical protein